MFGALASEPLKVSDGFYGTGETFLFTFNPEFEVNYVPHMNMATEQKRIAATP